MMLFKQGDYHHSFHCDIAAQCRENASSWAAVRLHLYDSALINLFFLNYLTRISKVCYALPP
jgi:hypothetical protein